MRACVCVCVEFAGDILLDMNITRIPFEYLFSRAGA